MIKDKRNFMKYILTVLFICLSFSLFSKEFDVCKKEYVNAHIHLIKNEYRGKIIDIELDSTSDGYAKIIYER